MYLEHDFEADSASHRQSWCNGLMDTANHVTQLTCWIQQCAYYELTICQTHRQSDVTLIRACSWPSTVCVKEKILSRQPYGSCPHQILTSFGSVADHSVRTKKCARRLNNMQTKRLVSPVAHVRSMLDRSLIDCLIHVRSNLGHRRY